MSNHARKRILMVLENESFPDDTRVLLEANTLQQAGYAVTVICPKGEWTSKTDTVDGVEVIRYPNPPSIGGVVGYAIEFLYSAAVAFIMVTWRFLTVGFDALHIHCPPDTNALIAYPFRWMGKKVVIDLHDLSPELFQAQRSGEGSRIIEGVLRFFERRACRVADHLISTNESQKQIQIERCGALPEQCTVVRNGPNENFVPGVQPIEELRNLNQIVVGYVGVIGVQDGVDYLVRAMEEVRSRRDDISAVVVGPGPAAEDLKELAKALGISDSIHFTGAVPFESVPAHIAAFDICVTPDPSNSYNDSCTTIKTMEYMAMGKPTVAFETHENRITAGGAALFAKDNDVSALADLICQLADDEATRNELGSIGVSRVAESLNWGHQQLNLLRIYGEFFAAPSLVS